MNFLVLNTANPKPSVEINKKVCANDVTCPSWLPCPGS